MTSRRLRNTRTRKLRVERLCQRQLLAGDMTNPDNALDVNGDSDVTAGDALAIINYMARMNTAEGELASASSAIYPDTNGDSNVSASDALRVINHLGEGEQVAPSEVNNTLQLNTPLAIANNNAGGQLFGLIVDEGNSPRIKFSADDITVTVTSPVAGRLDFTMNGNTESLSIKDGFRVEAIGSNNTLIFDGAIIPDDLNIEIVHGSNNVFQLINTIIGDDFIYRGNEGNDNLILDNGTVIGDRADIKTREGNDTIAIRGARIGDDLILHTDDGNDLLAVNGASVGDDAIIRMGDDNDTVSLANAQVRDKADIRGNRGLDALAADVATVAAGKEKIKDFEAQAGLANVDQVIANLLD